MRQLIIGVDVGGTNTDSVLLDPKSKQVLTWNKTVTTLQDVSIGITEAIEKLFVNTTNGASKHEVAAIIIGTTHFINAVVERDHHKLSKVAVLRLCSNYSKNVPPFTDFPPSLELIMNGYCGYTQGGFHVDGQVIQPLNKQDIINHCIKIKELGISSVVVNGIFSNLDPAQEIEAADIIKQQLPGVDVILSHKVSNMGYLERENASILNASIMKFARSILSSFQNVAKCMSFDCPVLLTQNDGTVLSIMEALQVPIKTFSSGPTNSMRGAAFLCADDTELVNKTALVVDIGGTSADIGELLPNGFPRLSSTYSIVGGVRMNFSMPHVQSIGLGGGSVVRQTASGHITVGPDSVGANIVKEAIAFGGHTITASDIISSSNLNHGSSEVIGDRTLVHIEPKLVDGATEEIKRALEELIEQMRTTVEPLPVILVGGGSFIAPSELLGASKVVRVPYHQVANAIGAAIGKISTTINEVRNIDTPDMREELIKETKQKVIELSVAKGCIRETVMIADIAVDKVNYTDNTYSIYIKAVGDVDYDRLREAYKGFKVHSDEAISRGHKADNTASQSMFREMDILPLSKIDLSSYIPTITSDKEWIISEVDAEFISIGNYVLGCGGGGHPYPEYLALKHKIRQGNRIRVVDPDDLKKHLKNDGAIITVAYAGSPTVASEQMSSNELEAAYNLLLRNEGREATGVMAVEIGGGNGLQGLLVASEDCLNIPCVDADLMGRAFPSLWQITPYIYGELSALVPCAFSDGNGNGMLIADIESEKRLEQLIRTILSQVGHSVGIASNPMTSERVVEMSIKRSLSLAWWIGRAVKVTQQSNSIAELPNAIIDAVGGPDTAKLVFQGKIVDSQRLLSKGHVYGEVHIFNDQTQEKISISFKNENIVVEKLQKDGQRSTLCAVPDLISVIDSTTGEAVGTPEYRYGLSVFVLAIAPNEQWTRSERAIEIGGVKSFGFDHIKAEPVGVYKEPISVIERFKDTVN